MIETRSTPYAIVRPGGNESTVTVTHPLPALAAPSGDGVIKMGAGGIVSANGIMLVPYGAGAATNTFSMNVYGWDHTLGGTARPLWVAEVLATFFCTMGTVPGLAQCDVDGSQLFCGTIVLVVGNANVSNETISPTGNTVSHVLVDGKGAKYISVLFGTGSVAASANALWKTL